MSTRIKGLEESKSEVSQTIDLTDYVDGPVDSAYAEAFAQNAIDTIIQRTERGLAPNGKPFDKYSTAYTKSLIFDAAGKSKTTVNLKLTGEMLGTLTVLDVSGSEVKLGWEDSLNNAKAFGHMSGMEGHPVLDGVTPARRFFGITESEAKDIVKKMGPPNGSVSKADKVTLENLYRTIKLFKGLFG